MAIFILSEIKFLLINGLAASWIIVISDEVIVLIQNNKLSQGHAKVLVGLENAFFVAKKIIEKKLSVRQAESLVKIFKSTKISKIDSKDANLKQLEKSVSDKLGLRVFIKNKKNNTGSVLFEYKDLDQLNKLIDVIKFNY